MIGYPRSRSLHLNAFLHGRWPRHFPLHEDREFPPPFEGIPDVLRPGQVRVDSPDRLVQPLADVSDVEIHHTVRPRPRPGRQCRPSRRRQGRKHTDHRPPHSLAHQCCYIRGPVRTRPYVSRPPYSRRPFPRRWRVLPVRSCYLLRDGLVCRSSSGIFLTPMRALPCETGMGLAPVGYRTRNTNARESQWPRMTEAQMHKFGA